MDMMQNQRPFEPIEDECECVRIALKNQEIQTRNLMEHQIFKGEQAYSGQHGEMKANIMLVVRHLEDARMRLGKVIQYAGDGVSIYDRSANDPRKVDGGK